MVRSVTALLAAAVLFSLPVEARAQQASEVIGAAGAGGTYYCIVSRCDVGATLVALGGYGLYPSLFAETGVRWQECPDCDRFLVGEGGLQLRYPGETVRPFLSAGAGVSSDPDFMGDHFGLYAGIGTWLSLGVDWGLRLEVRGRTVGDGDAMGETSLVLWRGW